MATEGSEKDNGQLAELNSQKVAAKLHHHLRVCSSAVKRAKTFEVQRIIKKLKSAASEEEKDELQSTLEALKAGNHVSTGALALRSKLVKSRLLPKNVAESESEGGASNQLLRYPLLAHTKELQISIEQGDDHIHREASAERAQAKLLSSKVISEQVSRAVRDLSSSLLKSKTEEVYKERMPHSVELSKSSTSRIKKRKLAETSAVSEVAAAATLADDGGMSDDDDIQENDIDNPSNGVRMPPSRGHDDGDKSLSVHPQKRNPERGAVKLAKKTRYAEMGGSDGTEEESDEQASLSGRLPALQTGFVAGRGLNLGRESDDQWSDGDAELESIDSEAEETKEDKGTKKNRKGQRARRALWEKKFGRNANHLKVKEKDTKQRNNFTRLQGQSRPSQQEQFELSVGPPHRRTQPSVHIAVPTAEKAKTTVAAMHPSWVAKQQQRKQAEAALQSTAAPKKIVFD